MERRANPLSPGRRRIASYPVGWPSNQTGKGKRWPEGEQIVSYTLAKATRIAWADDPCPAPAWATDRHGRHRRNNRTGRAFSTMTGTSASRSCAVIAAVLTVGHSPAFSSPDGVERNMSHNEFVIQGLESRTLLHGGFGHGAFGGGEHGGGHHLHIPQPPSAA